MILFYVMIAELAVSSVTKKGKKPRLLRRNCEAVEGVKFILSKRLFVERESSVIRKWWIEVK